MKMKIKSVKSVKDTEIKVTKLLRSYSTVKEAEENAEEYSSTYDCKKGEVLSFDEYKQVGNIIYFTPIGVKNVEYCICLEDEHFNIEFVSD